MKEFTVKPNNSGFVEGVDHLHLNQLLADLDTEEFLAKQAKAEQTARELNGDAKQPFHDAAQSTTARATKEQTRK